MQGEMGLREAYLFNHFLLSSPCCTSFVGDSEYEAVRLLRK